MWIFCFSVAAAALFILLPIANCVLLLKLEKCIVIMHNPEIIQNPSCWLKPINRNTTLLNLRFNVIQQANNVAINGQLYKKAEIIYRPFLINSTMNVCENMKTKASTAYSRILIPIIKPFSNIVRKCPYIGSFYIKDLQVTHDLVPQFWPPGSYKLGMSVFEKNEKGFVVEYFFTLTEVKTF